MQPDLPKCHLCTESSGCCAPNKTFYSKMMSSALGTPSVSTTLCLPSFTASLAPSSFKYTPKGLPKLFQLPDGLLPISA